VTTIPNATFSDMKITNLTLRDRMLVNPTLSLRYETTPDQLRYALAKLRELLLAHPRVTPDPARVRFGGFGDCSLNVDVFAYVNTQDWNEFLAIREDLHLRMMDIVAESGTGFAFPSRTLYFARDKGLDAARSDHSEEEVQRWRAEHKLPFPEFDLEFRKARTDTLDYPPDGSSSPTSDKPR
jgi:MscS family membrane protein